MPSKPIAIQIVEDEGIVALDLQNRLKSMGYAVTSISATGEDALLRARTEKPDIVLMDVNLKGQTDGITAAHRMRAEYDIPVIFLTAYSDEATLERAKITESYGYLIKPCGDRELKVAIEIGIFKAEADRKVRAMQRWLASTMKSLGDGVIGMELDGRINYMNPLAQVLTGWNFLNAKGRLLHEVFNAIDEETRLPIESPVKRALKEGLAVHFDGRTLLIQREKKEIPVDDSCAPIFDEKGKPIGVVLVFRDASAMREAEAEKMRLKDIAHRNEKLVSMGRIASGVAHDFNNLMLVVTGYTQMVLDEIPDSNAARRLKAVIDAGMKAAGVAQNLLAYSRQSPLLPEPCDLNDEISGMTRVLDAVCKGQVFILYDLCESPLPVCVDKSRLFQVLLNLTVNACDAMPNGGSITIKTSPVFAESGGPLFGVMKSGPAALISVSDTGTGIDEETQKRLFEPFFTNKKPGKGTGLGLATASGIIAQSGGHISLESQVGKGTTFYVCLPLRNSESDSGS